MTVALLVFWLTALPILIGSLVGTGMNRWKRDPIFLWVAGQIILWALFQLICVPFILGQKEFSSVVRLYGGICAALAALSLCVLFGKKGLPWKRFAVSKEGKRGRWQTCLWLVFVLLLVFQLVQTVCMAYSDGDDAFYVSTASIAEESNYMYRKLPYTGGATELDARHGLAPFPIWIAFLTRISKLPVVSTAHIVIPLLSIFLTYGIFYLIGARLFGRGGERLPLFLVLTELLYLFGNYSPYTPEKFLLTRSRQGKAALAGIILPFLFFLFLYLLDRLQEGQKMEWNLWLLLTATITAGCLCSTQGVELCGLLTGVVGVCAAFGYHRWKVLIALMSCCIPAACYAVLYFWIQ